VTRSGFFRLRILLSLAGDVLLGGMI